MPTLLFLLLHLLGCFAFSSSAHRRRRSHHHGSHQSLFKKKPTPPKNSLFSFLKNLFSPTNHTHISHPIPPCSIPSPSSSTRSLRVTPLSPDHSAADNFHIHIHPCPLCGEILPTPTLLDHHRATKHAVSDLLDDGDNNNILRIIFKTGWPDAAKPPTVHRILKIHHSPNALSRFEEYRELIKSRAGGGGGRNERCAFDGNELLRFYCTTFICGLDGGGACGHP